MTGQGVEVKPKLSFDERGHQKNEVTYFVYGVTGNGETPEQFFPVTEDFIGEGGSLTAPLAVKNNAEGAEAGIQIDGKEALGGLKFRSVALEKRRDGVIHHHHRALRRQQQWRRCGRWLSPDSTDKVRDAIHKTNDYWQEKVNVWFQTGNKTADSYLRWICFQPILRRLYGCSFFRITTMARAAGMAGSLWQDCLSLLFMNPDGVRQMIVDNYGGVRMDGTNATIIGEKQGRVQGGSKQHYARLDGSRFWPFLTTKLYIDQTGTFKFLTRKYRILKTVRYTEGRRLTVSGTRITVCSRERRKVPFIPGAF